MLDLFDRLDSFFLEFENRYGLPWVMSCKVSNR